MAAAGFIAVSLFAGFDHFHQTALVAAKAQENQDIVKTVATLKTRIEAIEATRSQEQTAELRKTLAEVKAATLSAQGVTASMGQLAQHVDKVEKEKGPRIDKLGEKLEQTASNRNAEIIARLEKLEKRPVTVAVAQPAAHPQTVARHRQDGGFARRLQRNHRLDREAQAGAARLHAQRRARQRRLPRIAGRPDDRFAGRRAAGSGTRAAN